MNGIQHATSPAAMAPNPHGATFWLVNSAVWSAYAGSLMIPWLGQYPVLDMLPNKVAIAASGIAVSGTLPATYGWLKRRSMARPRFLGAALVACLVGAFALDTAVIALTQGPDAILQRWDGTFGSLLGGVPMPGRIGQYLTLLVAWSLGLHFFEQHRQAASPRATAGPELTAPPTMDGTLSIVGTTVRARDGNRTILFDRDEIDWIAADGDYIRLHSGTRNVLLRATMKQSAAILAPLGFTRVHRSAIVNPRRVREIVRESGGEHSVVLQNGVRIRTGRNYFGSVERLANRT